MNAFLNLCHHVTRESKVGLFTSSRALHEEPPLCQDVLSDDIDFTF